MPTKRNKAGQQQPYVPEGHGDASGEYAEHSTGSNQHYVSPDDVKRQLGYSGEQPKTETTTPKDLSDKLNGVKEQPKQQETEITEEMKSADYTKKLVQTTQFDGYRGSYTNEASVSISRGSLSKDELDQFNKQIEDLYKEYPEMQKLTKIKVNNAKASSQGGYIATVGLGNQKSYELYINAGWLEKTPSERRKAENIDFYKRRIAEIENETFPVTDKEEMINYFNGKIKEYENEPHYNVITKLTNRAERLKSLLAHELMHRVFQYNVRSEELYNEIRDTYKKALDNGDAMKISKYASTSMQEFISEANSQMSVGIETPQYIVDIVNKIKGANK